MKKYAVLRLYNCSLCNPDVELTTDNLDDAKTLARIKSEQEGRKFVVYQLVEE